MTAPETTRTGQASHLVYWILCSFIHSFSCSAALGRIMSNQEEDVSHFLLVYLCEMAIFISNVRSLHRETLKIQFCSTFWTSPDQIPRTDFHWETPPLRRDGVCHASTLMESRAQSVGLTAQLCEILTPFLSPRSLLQFGSKIPASKTKARGIRMWIIKYSFMWV